MMPKNHATKILGFLNEAHSKMTFTDKHLDAITMMLAQVCEFDKAEELIKIRIHLQAAASELAQFIDRFNAPE